MRCGRMVPHAINIKATFVVMENVISTKYIFFRKRMNLIIVRFSMHTYIYDQQCYVIVIGRLIRFNSTFVALITE